MKRDLNLLELTLNASKTISDIPKTILEAQETIVDLSTIISETFVILFSGCKTIVKRQDLVFDLFKAMLNPQR